MQPLTITRVLALELLKFGVPGLGLKPKLKAYNPNPELLTGVGHELVR